MLPLDFTPRPYQQIALDFLKATPRANLYADMGLGKTAVVLQLIKELNLDDVLIVAPLRVAQSVWPPEAQKWRQFTGLDIAMLRGDPDYRRAFLLAPPRITTVNYDQLGWLYTALAGDWPFKTVICDESRRLQGFRLRKGTRRALALSQKAHTHVERWINLTGTPNTNGLTDLWGPQWFIDGGHSLGRTYSAFIQRWFYKDAVKKSLYAPLRPFPHAQAEIEERMRPTTLSIRAKDWFDVAKPIENIVWVDLPAVARQQYQKMERQFYAELENGTVTAANCAVKSGKLLQFASGEVYGEDRIVHHVHDEKIEALRSIISETNGANLLVVYQYVHEFKRLVENFPATDIRAAGAIDRWNEGRIPILLAHPASAGHGLNLQHGGHHIVFFTPTWDAELYLQVLERIGSVRQKQSGYDRPVYVHHIMARDTVDERVREARETKVDLMEVFINAMRRAV